MNEDQIRVLRHNRPEIVRVLAGESDLNYVMDRMEELGPRLENGEEDRDALEDGRPIPEWMRENIRAQNRTATEKARQFLDELERRGPGAYWSFLEALKDYHPFLHNTLMRTCSDNDMRKYVSGDDLSNMGQHVVQIDDPNQSTKPRKSRSRSNSNRAGKTSPFTKVEQANNVFTDEPITKDDSGKAQTETPPKAARPMTKILSRTTDLAEIKEPLTLRALSQEELCVGDNGAIIEDSHYSMKNIYTENALVCSIRSMMSAIHLWFIEFYTCLVSYLTIGNVHCLCPTQEPNEGLVKLDKREEVFIYIDQPDFARRRSKVFGVTRYGRHVLLPPGSFKKCNDPRGEEWFFPMEDDLPSVSEPQLHAILEGQPTGSFVVYRPLQDPNPAAKEDDTTHLYNLAVLYEHRIQTYPIYRYPSSEIGFSEAEKYPNICTLVKHHRLNRGTISCRLRLPYSRCKFNIEHHVADLHRIQLDEKNRKTTIGFGYASIVSKVHDQNGDCVALKVPRPCDIESELVQLDFCEEIRHMLNFKHINIVQSLGIYLADGLVHIAMEYHKHGDVQRCLLQGTLSSEDTPTMVEICEQTLSAIAFLKMRRVIHRDVAARNVLVADLDPIHVKLTDFGMSRFVRNDCYMAEKNEVMPLRWASPEVLTRLHYSSKSDIWALGMFFYEVFSGGQEPYNTVPDDQVLMTVIEKKAIPEQPKCCPMGLYNLMTQCWKFSPGERPEVDGLLRCVRRNCRSSPPSPHTTQNESSQTEDMSLSSRLENLYTLEHGSVCDKVKRDYRDNQVAFRDPILNWTKRRKKKVGHPRPHVGI